jgi:hypothetical protein
MSQTKLAARAQKLSRQIFASLPFEVRFGFMLEALVDDWTVIRKNLGRALYAEYIKAGVPDMPLIGSMPASEHPAKELGAHAALKLPESYGGRHAGEIIATARKNIPFEEDTKEFLGDFLVMVTKGKLKIDNLHDLKNAESHTLMLVDWRAKDYVRRKNRRPDTWRGVSLTDTETGKDFDFEDPKGIRGVIQRIKPGDRNKLLGELRSVDPKHPEWPEQAILGHLLEGKSWRDLGPEFGVKWEAIYAWWQKYEPKIKKVFEKYFWAMSEAV